MKRFSVLRVLALIATWGVALAAGGATFVYKEIARDLPPNLDKVLLYQPARATRVYSADGQLIGEFFLEKRVLTPLARIPLHVQNAFIAAEDRRFRSHHGFDPWGIARAAWENYAAGGVRQGASTITQQVARMLLLTNERTFIRKGKELILSVRVERELSKDRILYIYLNQVYLGHGAYGVQAAAEIYFGKDVEHLTIAEGAMLAGLPKAPTKLSPYKDWARSRERQAYVLERMADDGLITRAQAEAARREPLALVARAEPLSSVAAPYFVEQVRRWAAGELGDRALEGGGLRIHTTLDLRRQLAAEAALRRGLEALDRRLGFRGPIGHLDGADRDAATSGPPRLAVADARGLLAEIFPGVPYAGVVVALGKRSVDVDLGPRTLRLVDEDAARVLRWKGDKKRRVQAGDVLPVALTPDGNRVALAQAPEVQAALVGMDPATGDVRSLVGGYDYARSVFDRAIQSKRQAGSAMKPFIYATALANGFTPLSIVPDAPIAVRTASGVWAPSNYQAGKFLGPITLRTALANSINTVSVRLTLAVGVDAVRKTMRALGITTPIPRHISIALGTPDVSLLEMTAAYAAFPAGGRKVTPRFVTKVTDDEGRTLYDAPAAAPAQAIAPEIAYLMVDLMKGVVRRGTARKAQELGRPAAGKTGTSTGFRDAWFIGYTPDFIAGIWVGRDNFKPIGYDTTGGSTALPIWLDYMKVAVADQAARDFVPPPDVTFVRASELSGEPVGPGSPAATWVPFARGTVPRAFTASVSAEEFSRSVGFP